MRPTQLPKSFPSHFHPHNSQTGPSPPNPHKTPSITSPLYLLLYTKIPSFSPHKNSPEQSPIPSHGLHLILNAHNPGLQAHLLIPFPLQIRRQIRHTHLQKTTQFRHQSRTQPVTGHQLEHWPLSVSWPIRFLQIPERERGQTGLARAERVDPFRSRGHACQGVREPPQIE